jgi:hydroxyacylglutathione hydrolase
VGDFARPALVGEPRQGAREIFHSLHDRLLTLPDTCEVWPGHLGGSLCGGPGMDLKVSSTVGYEREHSELLGVSAEEEFVERATGALRPQPPNFERIVARNRGPLRVESVEVHPLTPRQVDTARGAGALVVDVRTDLQFDEAHIPGAVSVTALRAGFGSKLAWLVAPEQSVVLVGRDDEDARRAASLAESVGVTRLAGFLAGGMTSWREEGLPVERIERLTVPQLRDRAGELQILDVRDQGEWEAGHIEGSVHLPYYDIHGVPDGLDAARPVAVICSSGQRAAPAASLLRRHGVADVLHVVEGGVRDYMSGR